MGNTSKGCSVPANGHRYQLAVGTTLSSLVQKENPLKSKKKKDTAGLGARGHGAAPPPLPEPSGAAPHHTGKARAEPESGAEAAGAVFGFCAWPLPVLSPYLCVRQALLTAPSLSERARGERGGEEREKR